MKRAKSATKTPKKNRAKSVARVRKRGTLKKFQAKTPKLVRECMTASVDIASPDMSIAEAAQKMRNGDFGALPVGSREELLGLVTDRDITTRAVAEGKDSHNTKLRDIMSSSVLFCYDDQTVEEAVNTMGKHQVRRLPVKNRENRIVGIVSLGDIAERKECANQAREALSQISEHQHREPKAQATA